MYQTKNKLTVDVVGWAATIVLIVSYALSTRAFDLANATLWPFIAAPAIMRRSWPNVFICVTFGLVGIWRLIWNA